MSDLQDALRRHDLWWSGSNDHQRHKDRQMFAEAARKVANPDLSALDDMPPLYEISPKSLPHLEALGLIGSGIVRVTNKRIIESTLAALGGTKGEE